MGDEYRIFRPEASQINDWSGQLLDPGIRRLVDVGHSVRIQVMEAGVDSGWADTPYVLVTERDGDRLTGVVDDPYRWDDEYDRIVNGQVIEFDRADITEIPLDWEGNEALAAQAEHTGPGRDVTGMIEPD